MTCEIDDCSNPAHTRGLCPKHYQRLARHGDPLYEARIVGDPVRRYWSYVNKTDTCWLWVGPLTRGYGVFSVGTTNYLAHRVAYFRGIPPKGKSGTIDIDHLCRVTNCVNPAHLEEVPHGENVRRGRAGEVARARAAAITHCPRGHAYEGENLIVSQGKRKCRECSNARRRKS